ncbi:helix-turn-helix domain-containing protein [Bradyrhizobium sp. CB2312]|uniref:helix-turn-helix domain-containing protein n=1 Tax=Bradyrhizobium sp. CB2312 TaxID=3039155 RepID=UPI0024B0BC5C|nr:helix-turn-helix domain-containing protein [Bradyrhizobium sp. CB2312]WFU73686.1 helix-turn-helix domain-containing protein [Bradyrhizobium sp. CB2312]
MDRSRLNIARDGAQKVAANGVLSFQGLRPSSALELQSYDFDHFGETERYAGASSMPLSAGTTAIMRARLSLPNMTLSLVRTFPRIIRGYDLAHAVAVVVPMDHVTATRINGQTIGSSIVILKGVSDCLVYEPAGRLIGVAYFSPPGRESWAQLSDGYHLLNTAPCMLAALRGLISATLETAAYDPDFPDEPASRGVVEQSLFGAIDAAIRTGVNSAPVPSLTNRYRRIVVDMEESIRRNLMIWPKTTELAEQMGVSVRTLQSATLAICGMSPNRYSRVLRLWSVRKQLRVGPAARSVKSCAIAHGFWHLSEFAASYRAAFGELPSETLHRSLRGE